MAVSQKSHKRRKAKLVEQPEPTVVNTADECEYAKALNWYNYTYDADAARKFLVEYMKKNKYAKADIEALKRIAKHDVATTAGWIARIITNGNQVQPSTWNFFSDRVDQMIARGRKIAAKQKAKAAPTMTIQERIAINAKALIADAEAEVIDARGSMYNFLIANEVGKPQAEIILEYYKPIYDEIHSNDQQIKEGFQNLRAERKFWKTVIGDLERYVLNKAATKKVRKPRKKKAKDPNDIVKNVKYQKADPSLKLVSVDPANMVGAQQVWIYNTSRQLLTQYVARGPAGLQISRSSIKGFDVDLSKTKSARRDTEVVLKSVLRGGKVQLRKLLKNIKASESKASGRLNENSIILRVVK